IFRKSLAEVMTNEGGKSLVTFLPTMPTFLHRHFIIYVGKLKNKPRFEAYFKRFYSLVIIPTQLC
ncbi:MAG: hypothetical protein IJI83_04050, partial [Oscillospiraceae bacterium]|nr:hypothetical protein [Oscillospiraceae bacterium]